MQNEQIIRILRAFGAQPDEGLMNNRPVIGYLDTSIGRCHLTASVSKHDGQLDICFGNVRECVEFWALKTIGAFQGDKTALPFVRAFTSSNGTPVVTAPIFLRAMKELSLSVPPLQLKTRCFQDGDQWCCVGWDFEDLQASPAAFSDTAEAAQSSFRALICGEVAPALLVWPYPTITQAWESGDRKFFETTEGVYDEQLGVLPPTVQVGGAFLTGEPYTHIEEEGRIVPLYTGFYRVEGRVFCRKETVRDFALRQSVPAIRQQFGL